MHKIADVAEAQEPGVVVIEEIEGREIALINVEGEYYAVLNYCPHQSGPLCEGEVSGHVTTEDDGWTWKYEPVEKCISCPWHGWQFDVTTGTNTKDARYSVPRFGVKVVDEEIFVTANRPE